MNTFRRMQVIILFKRSIMLTLVFCLRTILRTKWTSTSSGYFSRSTDFIVDFTWEVLCTQLYNNYRPLTTVQYLRILDDHVVGMVQCDWPFTVGYIIIIVYAEMRIWPFWTLSNYKVTTRWFKMAFCRIWVWYTQGFWTQQWRVTVVRCTANRTRSCHSTVTLDLLGSHVHLVSDRSGRLNCWQQLGIYKNTAKLVLIYMYKSTVDMCIIRYPLMNLKWPWLSLHSYWVER